MTDNRNLEKQADALSDNELDKVNGGLVNASYSAGFSAGGGSIPSKGGLSLEPVNTRKDLEELNKGNTLPNPFPQNCG